MTAKTISLGPWTISARRAPAGTLVIEVLLGDASRARIELDGGKTADESRRSKQETDAKLEVDMRF